MVALFPVISQFAKPSFNWISLLIQYAVLAVFFGGIGWYLQNGIVMAIGKEGLYGQGGSKRKLTFSWSDEMLLKETVVSGFKYLLLTPVKKYWFLPISSASQIYIPEHIYQSNEFNLALKKHAPAGHALRMWLLNQPPS